MNHQTSPEPDSSQATHDTEEADETAGSPEGEQKAGAQVSEAGGASLNEETSEGGADAVPDAHG
ncbi:MAG: hypothetical protein WA892_08085 [Ornithinimicrobium sp.]